MQWKRQFTGLMFSCIFIATYFTNKFVLSVLKFTYPTLFQGWQTCVGALLLVLCGKLGWLELSRITRSTALPWLPGSLLFVGNIYAGSRSLSSLSIPIFFTLQNASHVVSFLILKLKYAEKLPWSKTFSVCLLLISAVSLPLCDSQVNIFIMAVSSVYWTYSISNLKFDKSGYMWAVCHLSCEGAYRVFQVYFKSSHLSDLEQQYINYLSSVFLLAIAAHPTGDILGALEFPFLWSYTFHCVCCASALLGFLLLLVTIKLRSGLSLEHCRAWVFLSKVTAMCLCPLLFTVDINTPSLLCVLSSHLGLVALMYSEREGHA